MTGRYHFVLAFEILYIYIFSHARVHFPRNLYSRREERIENGHSGLAQRRLHQPLSSLIHKSQPASLTLASLLMYRINVFSPETISTTYYFFLLRLLVDDSSAQERVGERGNFSASDIVSVRVCRYSLGWRAAFIRKLAGKFCLPCQKGLWEKFIVFAEDGSSARRGKVLGSGNFTANVILSNEPAKI